MTTILSIQGLGKEGTRALKAGVTGLAEHYARLVRAAGEPRARRRPDWVSTFPAFLSQAADHALSLAKGDQVAGLSRG